MGAIFQRELRSFFQNVTGYVIIMFVLLFAGIYTMALNLNAMYPNFEYVLNSMSFIFLIIIPILTMRSIAEERRQHTDQLLYALPMGMTDVVLGKFLAMVVVMAVPLAVMGLYPFILSFYGTVSFKLAWGALIGFLFLGAALVAIGTFISSLTENQAVAAGLCFVIMLLLYFMSDLSGYVSSSATASFIALTVAVVVVAAIFRLLTKNTPASIVLAVLLEIPLVVVLAGFPEKMEGLFPSIMQTLSVFDRFYPFVNGVFDLTALIYYLTVMAVFLFLTVQAMEKRRWS